MGTSPKNADLDCEVECEVDEVRIVKNTKTRTEISGWEGGQNVEAICGGEAADGGVSRMSPYVTICHHMSTSQQHSSRAPELQSHSTVRAQLSSRPFPMPWPNPCCSAAASCGFSDVQLLTATRQRSL